MVLVSFSKHLRFNLNWNIRCVIEGIYLDCLWNNLLGTLFDVIQIGQ